MNLASSSYYYQPKADLDRQARSDAELRDHIERIQGEFAGYGYRRVGKQLRREGIRVNDKRIRRVQRKYQLFPIRWHSFKIATTDSNHGHKVYPNLLAGLTLTGTNQAWVADITYIRILKGFVFLAALLDRYSRKVIGWAISKRIDAELCLAALKSALDKRQPPPGCIHHSDRGVQYACQEYVAVLEGAHMKISMSRTGNPYDNAHMESFFKTLKYEEVHLSNYETYRRCDRTASPFHRGGVQQETIAFGPGVFTPGGIRDDDSTNQNRRSRSPQISVKSLQSEGRSPISCSKRGF